MKKMARAPMIWRWRTAERKFCRRWRKERMPSFASRSDYPERCSHHLPVHLRGALDVGATAINEEMKLAAVRAIAELAHAEQSEVVASAYAEIRI